MTTGFPITSLFVALFIPVFILFGSLISLSRFKNQVAYGDGDIPVLRRRVRAHGNLQEWAPIGLLAMALVEAGGAEAWVLWTIGGLLAAGRLLHAAGTYRTSTPLRGGGMVLTYLSLLGSAACLLCDWVLRT